MTLKEQTYSQFSSDENLDPRPSKEDVNTLSALIEKYAPHEGRFEICDEVHVFKAFAPSKGVVHTLSEPAICLVTQGAKKVSAADMSFEYSDKNLVIYAAEVPIRTQISKASKEEPMLCLVIPINLKKLNELILKAFPKGVSKSRKSESIYVGDSTDKIVKSAIRMMHIISEQENADLLLPLAIDEIIIRLLRSPAGESIAQIGITDSHAQKISKTITWIKDNYTNQIKAEDLAKIAGMSLTSFHTHFKNVTAMSPIQFQKTLRLYEARNLITSRTMDISNAAYHVGYASTSQFSREYSREFGVSPSKDTGISY